jgi:hypothetical protein
MSQLVAKRNYFGEPRHEKRESASRDGKWRPSRAPVCSSSAIGAAPTRTGAILRAIP